ncbi:hypothetical protein LZ554_003973 [Drepanopeziza brunnea f. sp. 'monogermtubi']|nr:hypothetical protein LZ554_003973 [Drepanopeziza brunnea f. sp. 'monogermtubi']
MHLAKRLRSGRNYAAESSESSYILSRRGSYRSPEVPSLELDSGFVAYSYSRCACKNGILSKAQDGRPRPHGTTFEGACDFCRRTDILTLLVLVSNASPTTTPSDQNVRTTPSTSRIASPSLSEIFYAHVCCSRCALLIVPPAASILPVPIRFGLRLDTGRESAIAGVSMWRAGLEDLFPRRRAGLETSDGYYESFLLALLQTPDSAEWLRGSRRDDDRSMLELALHWVTAEI